MYLPVLRGKQYEMLALKECLDNNLLGENILPVVEPVKVGSYFFKTIQAFIDKGKEIAVVRNPKVGSWNRELSRNDSGADKLLHILNDEMILSAYYASADLKSNLDELDKTVLLFDTTDAINVYTELSKDNLFARYNLIPDRTEFRRRVRTNSILFEDHFNKKERNSDYSDSVDEAFSMDHLYYKEDGHIGFSDYSIIGKDYSEMGFAPYAVAIHIVYLDDDKALRVRHFVSDSNDSYHDVAGKFYEALKKLVQWNEKQKLNTLGIRIFEDYYKEGKYPGLGMVKKLSLMHHFELINNEVL